MRKLFSLLSVALVALFAVGCETPGEGTTGVTFDFQNAKTTTNTVSVDVVPSDNSVMYMACVVEAVTISDLVDAAIIDKFLGAEGITIKKGSTT